MLGENRLATLVALIALALGTGANTAIFSVVHAVLLRPLAYHNAEQLVTVLSPNSSPVAPAVFFELKDRTRSYAALEAAQAWGANMSTADAPEQVHGLRLTPEMFPLLGVPALRGRADVADTRSLVISYGLWQRRFGGADSAVGSTLTLDGENYTIAGVMPPDFRFAPFWITDAEMWSTLDLTPRRNDRRGASLRIFGRLAPGASAKSAQAEATRISNDLAQSWPESVAGLDLRVDPLREKVVGKVRPALMILLGAVAMVLLIACANVASVALARAMARRREMAIRLSLGAARWRIVRQLLTESVVLALAGGALGLLLALWGTRAAIVSALPLPRGAEIGIGGEVLLFTLALSVITGLFFGLAPALAATRTEVADVLRATGRGVAASSRGRRLLVAGEIALVFVLLAGAGLLLRSFAALRSIDPGFDASHLLTLSVSVAGQPSYIGDSREQLYRTLLDRIASTPGVRGAAMINHLPLAGDVWGTRLAIEGRPAPRPGEETNAVFRVALPGYFQTLRIPLAAGRDFNVDDRAGRPAVILINDALARHEFGGAQAAVGKRLRIDSSDTRSEWLTVVGVVRNVRQGSWTSSAENEIYLPFAQDPFGFRDGREPHVTAMMIAVRTTGEPTTAANAVRAAIRGVDRHLPVSKMESMDEVIAGATSQSRLETMLVGLFATVALVLSVVGIYGMVAYEVARRTREIGIRMALGASAAAVLKMVARENLPVAAGGIGAGMAVAMVASRMMESLLYQVQPGDPGTYSVVTVLVLLTIVLAAMVPALRAARTDPAGALRQE